MAAFAFYLGRLFRPLVRSVLRDLLGSRRSENTYHYSISKLIYLVLGTGICHDQATETAPYPNDNGEYCDPFIYPILDWENNAGMAFGVIAGGCLVIPVLHFLWMGLAWLREKVFSCCRGTNDDYVDSDGNARRFASTTV